jgi:hypothetical protein
MASNILPFFCLEQTTFVPGTSTLSIDEGYNAAPWSALAQLADQLTAGGTILASDVGYRTLPTDPSGPIAYPPWIDSAFQMNRQMNLDPSRSSVAGAWGQVRLSNQGNRFDSVVAVQNSDARDTIIRYGEKTWNQSRMFYPDPSISTLTVAFHGIASPWVMTETELQIPIQDATYWLNQPYQTNLYDGSGTYGGGANLAGLPKPITRGGTAAHAVQNVTPTLMDATNLIYQYNNCAGTVVALYEGGFATFTSDGDVANLYAGSVSAGHYRTDNSRGLFQLGSAPTSGLPITCDVTGQFPIGGVINLIVELAQWALADDIQLPNTYFDATSFTAIDAKCPYIAGFFIPTSASLPTGLSVIDFLLSSIGAKLVPLRNGRLGCLLLRTPPNSVGLADTFSAINIVSALPVVLPNAISPPTFRVRVGYQKNYTLMSSGISASATAARRAYIGTTGNVVSSVNSTVQTAYARPNDLPIIDSALLVSTDAQAVSDAVIALWGVQRRLYDVEVSQRVGIKREFGDFIGLNYSIAGLPNGTVGQFVGDQMDSATATSKVRILV